MKTEEFKAKLTQIMRAKGYGPKRRYPEECLRKKGHKTPGYPKTKRK